MAIAFACAAVVLAVLGAAVLAVIAGLVMLTQIAAMLVAPQGRGVATILVIDVVGSTAAISAAGDAAWDVRYGAFASAARRELGRVPAVVVKDLGDGLLAAFPLVVSSPAKVVDAARRLQREAAERGISLRAGIHAGECSLSRRDVRGLAVHVASRVASSAEPGQVLLSAPVRELVAGSDVALESLGERAFKGVTDPMRVYAVATS